MTARYLGEEPAFSRTDVIRYLEQNYEDEQGRPMPPEMARKIAEAGAEQIEEGIRVFRSNACYLGDEAVRNHGAGRWTEIPVPEGDEEDNGSTR